MRRNGRLSLALLPLLAFWTLSPVPARAADHLVVSSGHQTGWDTLVINFGVRKGFFQAQGLDIELVELDTGAPTIQAIVSNSVDLAAGVSMPGFMGAAMKGAPLIMISANFTGTSDFVWYVRADSPIKSFKDITENTTVAYSSAGSTSQLVALSLMKQAGVAGKGVAAGNAPAALTQVMTGQLDIGFDGNGGMGVPEFEKGKVRVVASGGELESMRDQTVRGIVVTRPTLTARRDQLVRFLAAYRQTVDWMVQDPQALQWFADQNKTSLAEAKRVVDLIYPARALRLGPVQGLDKTIAQAVELKRIPQAPTAEQISEMFDNTLAPTN